MGSNSPDMVDLAFDLKGSLIPADYAFELWREVARILPWLDAEELAGILPLRGSDSEGSLLLANRAKLVLRLPVELAAQAGTLSGQKLNMGSGILEVGTSTKRPLQSYTTLHAHLVEGAEEEEVFLEGVAVQLQAMEVSCNWICGKRNTLTGIGQSLSGYSLVLHDLKPEASLLVQRAGLGGSRHFGCGIFIPYKDISGLD